MGKLAKQLKNGTKKVKSKTYAEAEKEVAVESGLSPAAAKKMIKAHRKEKDLTEEEKRRFTDLNLGVAVLCNSLVSKMEELEEYGLLYGDIKYSVKGTALKLDKFMTKAFSVTEESVGEGTKREASTGVLVIQEKVEAALTNQYVLSVDERRKRAESVLSKFLIGQAKDLAMKELENLNMFNF